MTESITALRQAIEQPAQERPQNCGTGYCSCIECLYEQPAPAQDADHMEDVLAMVERPTK